MYGIDTFAIEVSSTFMNTARDMARVPIRSGVPSSGGRSRGGARSDSEPMAHLAHARRLLQSR